MQAEQAIFTSARTARMSGYQLVARSPGIDSELAAALSLWGPTHGSMCSDDSDAMSLSSFRVDAHRVALARTVYGGPEYSGRGRQIVTAFLVMTETQWWSYDSHALRVYEAAHTAGHLRLTQPQSDQVPTVHLPDETPVWATGPRDIADNALLLDDAARCLDFGQRVALIGVERPLQFLDRLIGRTPIPQRQQLSFSTGLRISPQRPFRVHFLSEADFSGVSLMNSLGITCLWADPSVTSTRHSACYRS